MQKPRNSSPNEAYKWHCQAETRRQKSVVTFVLKPSDDEIRTVALEHGMSSIEVMGLPGRGSW
jgi:hypothetical protein